jgi:hypothetical protein
MLLGSPASAQNKKAVQDDAYDPFTDFADFAETSDEEADINFFRNGRFLNIGFSVGSQILTEGLGKYTRPAVPYGFFLGYFFDLRFALLVGFSTGTHSLKISGSGFETVSSDVEISRLAINFKYYLNTQNVTRGFANLNPFAQLGFSQVTRGISEEGNLSLGKDSAMALDLGLGIEFPILSNRMFLGLQGLYHIVSFQDENKELQVGTTDTNIVLNGDIMTIQLNVGTNF